MGKEAFDKGIRTEIVMNWGGEKGSFNSVWLPLNFANLVSFVELPCRCEIRT